MPFEPASLVIGAVTAAGLAALTLLAETANPNGAILVTPEVIEILAHKTLRLYCLIGAIGGGVLAVAMMGQTSAREMATKWAVGVLSGVLFTPWMVRVFGIHPSPDYIVPGAAMVALLAWGVLHKLAPVLERLFVGRVRRMLGDKSDPSPPTP